MLSGKYPFPTCIPFTQQGLREIAVRVRELGLVEVQVTSKGEPGLHARIYESERVALYSRTCVDRRPVRIWLGELGVISLAQARQKHRAFRLSASTGEDPRTPRIAAMRYCDLHEQHYVVQCHARGKKTVHTDASRYAHWIGPEFGDQMVSRITKTDLSRFVLRMQEAGLAAATIKATIGQVSATLDIALDLGIIARNPAKGLRTPSIRNQRTEFMDVNQVRAFMDAAQASEDVVGSRMLMLMALTGARLGEAVNAKWIHISLADGTWHLPTQKSNRPGTIYLSAAAKLVIGDLISHRWNEWLFPGAKGNPRRSRPIKLFRRLCEKAGIPPKKFRLHDLRHAWCSLGNLAGIPLEIISLGARHSSPTVTRIYSHAHQESLVAASEKIANLIMPPMAA
jgi:integrase